MIDQYQNTVIRFQTDAKEEYDSVEIGIERSYQPNRRGCDFSHTKTGPWCVMIKNGHCLSTGNLPPDAARQAAAAIIQHAEECERRNNPPESVKADPPEVLS